jgi:hypothetical protein
MSEVHLHQLVDGKFRGFCKESGIAVKKTSRTEVYKIPDTHLLGLFDIIQEIASTSRAVLISLNSLIVQLSSQFDILVAEIVAEIIRQKPEILNNSERKIEYADPLRL